MDDISDFYKFPKAELHTHLDGSMRPSLIYHYAKIKNLPDVNDVYSMHKVITETTISDPCLDLNDYLSRFALPNKAIAGLPDAIYQLAYETCYEKYNANVFYSELRFSPHLLMNDGIGNEISLQEVLKIVIKGITDASNEINVKISQKIQKLPEFKTTLLLCGIWGFPSWLDEAVDLAAEVDPEKKFVVGVDLAGGYPDGDDWQQVAEVKGYEKAFVKAKQMGYGVTVHAGECKGPDSVAWAIEKCQADRIGHGYRIFLNEEITAKFFSQKDQPWHFEFCPRSSILTNAQKEEKHCLEFVRPTKLNMSLSTDDEGVQLNTLGTEYEYCMKRYGWDQHDFIASNENALKAAFSKEVDQKYIDQFLACYQK